MCNASFNPLRTSASSTLSCNQPWQQPSACFICWINARKFATLFTPAPEFRHAIEFRQVSFAYARGDQVLRDVSFTLRKGERLALTGPTGAGKSSIVSLLCRFYEPQHGQIL